MSQYGVVKSYSCTHGRLQVDPLTFNMKKKSRKKKKNHGSITLDSKSIGQVALSSDEISIAVNNASFLRAIKFMVEKKEN